VGVDAELWMLAITAACAIIPWAFSIHAKVAVIASSVESLPDIIEDVRQSLEEHELRLNEHAQEIATLKTQAGTGR